jgi:glutamate/tyrosine decarboxylase-like PLP-dependent enzyme
MQDFEIDTLFTSVADYAKEFLEHLPDRPVGATATYEQLQNGFESSLPEDGMRAELLIKELASAVEPGLVASPSGRFFGFVFGGAIPATVAADWLTSTWDQNAALAIASPAAAVVEEIAGHWLAELLGVPQEASFALVTGAQMANFTCLAAARHHVLARQGWDVQRQGLQGAPPVTVVANETRHNTIDRAVRYLGLGTDAIVPVTADREGRMELEALRDQMSKCSGPVIVCAQAGNVNSGAFDPFQEICAIASEHGAWVHIDGAFGLWAAASSSRRHLIEGSRDADSWATDAHKWLNVPYDSGIAFCAHPESHRAAMSAHASYLMYSETGERDAMDWTPEASRRARGFSVYAAIRHIGRSGVATMIDRCCDHAQRFAEILGADPDVEILNDVVLNQVLVRFLSSGGDHDAKTRAVIASVQQDGTCWMSGTTWNDMAAMRISVSNWSTTTDDVQRSTEAILRIAGSL